MLCHKGGLMSAIFENQAVRKPMPPNHVRRQPNATRIADLSRRESDGFRDVLTVITLR